MIAPLVVPDGPPAAARAHFVVGIPVSLRESFMVRRWPTYLRPTGRLLSTIQLPGQGARVCRRVLPGWSSG